MHKVHVGGQILMDVLEYICSALPTVEAVPYQQLKQYPTNS